MKNENLSMLARLAKMFPSVRQLAANYFYVYDDVIVNAEQALRRNYWIPGYAYAGESLVLPDERGLLAARDIPYGTPVASYGGAFITVEEADRRPRTPENAYLVGLPDGLGVIDGNPALPESAGHIGMFANDVRGTGLRPNAQIEIYQIEDEGQTRYYAVIATIRAVRAGEEILLDYGTDYWEESESESSGSEFEI